MADVLRESRAKNSNNDECSVWVPVGTHAPDRKIYSRADL